MRFTDAIKDLRPEESASVRGLIETNDESVDENGNHYADLRIFIDECIDKFSTGDFGFYSDEMAKLWRKRNLEKQNKNMYGEYEIESGNYAPEVIYKQAIRNEDGSINKEESEKSGKRRYVISFITDFKFGGGKGDEHLIISNGDEFSKKKFENQSLDWENEDIDYDEDPTKVVRHTRKGEVTKYPNQLATTKYTAGQGRKLLEEVFEKKDKGEIDVGVKTYISKPKYHGVKGLSETAIGANYPRNISREELREWNKKHGRSMLPSDVPAGKTGSLAVMANELKSFTRDDLVAGYKEYIGSKIGKTSEGQQNILDLMRTGETTDKKGTHILEPSFNKGNVYHILFDNDGLATKYGLTKLQVLDALARERASKAKPIWVLAIFVAGILQGAHPSLLFNKGSDITSLVTNDSAENVDVNDLEENVKIVDLEEEFWAEDSQGHKVVAIYEDVRSGRLYVIVYRESDRTYILGAGYCLEDGTWGQGYYDFRTQENAEKYLEKEYSYRTLRQIK